MSTHRVPLDRELRKQIEELRRWFWDIVECRIFGISESDARRIHELARDIALAVEWQRPDLDALPLWKLSDLNFESPPSDPVLVHIMTGMNFTLEKFVHGYDVHGNDPESSVEKPPPPRDEELELEELLRDTLPRANSKLADLVRAMRGREKITIEELSSVIHGNDNAVEVKDDAYRKLAERASNFSTEHGLKLRYHVRSGWLFKRFAPE
jgi:hypothetical protein